MVFNLRSFTATSAALAMALSIGMTSAPAFADTTAVTAPAAEAPAQVAAGDQVAQGGAFADVPTTHWAYPAVAQLEKEGYIKNYPDGQFKGNRPMSRYEVAELVARADTAIRNAIASGQTVKPADIAALKKLLDEFGKEVKDVQNRVSALETKTDALDKRVTATTAMANASRIAINRAHFNYNLLFRPGTAVTNFQVTNGPTVVAGIAPGQSIPATGVTPTSRGTAYNWGSGSLNSNVPGITGNGTMYDYARFAIGGQIARGWSYGARLTTAGIRQVNPNGTTTGTGFCTNLTITNCSYDNLNGAQSSIPVLMEYADLQWTSPGGVYGIVGKFPVGEGNYTFTPVTQLFAGQNISGAGVGIRDPKGVYQAQLFYGYSGVSALTLSQVNAATPLCAAGVVGLNRSFVAGGTTTVTDFNPNCNESTNEVAGSVQYLFKKSRTVVSGAVDHFNQKLVPLWDSAAVSCAVGATTFAAINPTLCNANGGTVTTARGGAGNYFTGQANIGVWEVAAAQYFGNKVKPQFQLAGSYSQRMGNDPFTGTSWVGKGSVVLAATYASKGNLANVVASPFLTNPGTADSNVVQFAFYQFGQNGLFGVDAGPTAGTPTPTNALGLSNLNGMRVYALQYAHWFNNNVRMGLVGIHAQNQPGVGLMIGANGLGGVNACPGCSGAISVNELNLETLIQM